MIFLVALLGTINSFSVINWLVKDTSEYSILPLLSSNYTIEYEKNLFQFLIPSIHTTISDLPVIIHYTPSDKSSWSSINFNFTPLAKENSKRIYSGSISFKLFLEKKLQKDIKQDVLERVANIKNGGLISGAGRAISTKHFEQYEN